MIEITIGGVTAVQMKNGQIKLARKGDRLEADPKNESYHVKNGHAVFVETKVSEADSGKKVESVPGTDTTDTEKDDENHSETDVEEKPKQTKTRKSKKTDGEVQA